jgi:hypothetical protein
MVLAATACGPQAASPSPDVPARPSGSAPPSPVASDAAAIPGLTWAAADVERPPGMSGEEPSIPPVSEEGGGLGHPGHFSGQGYVVDVADGPAGLVAAGYAFPGWHATAWTSDDGQRWARHLVDEDEDTFVQAIAVASTGYVAAGRAGQDAAAWTSSDGVTWQRAAGPPPEPGYETRMTSLAGGPDGIVAVGWARSPTAPTSPRFWRSIDGRAWELAQVDDASAVDVDDEARGASVTQSPSGWLAVGTTGRSCCLTGSTTWTSPDGRSWTRHRAGDALRAGQMASVAATPDGYLAVGSDLDERQGVSWVSPDGVTWTASEPQAALDNHGLKIRMTDAVADGARLVAVGDYLFGTQYGNATSWTSTDGLTWTPAPRAAVLNQGEMLAIVAADPGYVAVGTFGAPDDYVPTIWLSPRGS